MAWNRPNDQTKTAHPTHRKMRTKRVLFYVSVLGLLFVVIALLLFRGVIIGKDDLKSKDRLIESDSSQSSSTRTISSSHENFEKNKSESATNPIDIACVGATTDVLRAIVVRPTPTRELFSNPAEDALAAVVCVPIGELVIDDDVPPDFEEDFKASLTNKIVIHEDDTEQEKEEKRRVIEAKAELKKRWLLGEDIVEIVKQEKRDLMKLHDYQQELEDGLNDLRDSGATIEAIGDYAIAAKCLMKEKSIEVNLPLSIDEGLIVKRFEDILNGEKNDQ